VRNTDRGNGGRRNPTHQRSAALNQREPVLSLAYALIARSPASNPPLRSRPHTHSWPLKIEPRYSAYRYEQGRDEDHRASGVVRMKKLGPKTARDPRSFALTARCSQKPLPSFHRKQIPRACTGVHVCLLSSGGQISPLNPNGYPITLDRACGSSFFP